MTSLYASRWATTPPADEPAQNTIESGLSNSQWATKSPDAEQKVAQSSVLTPPWVDSPPPVQMEQREFEGVERLLKNSERLPVAAENDVGDVGVPDEDGAQQQSEPAAEEVKIDSEVSAETGKLSPPLEVDAAAKSESAPVIDTNETPASPSKVRPDAPRLKKKVIWRGKTCVVSIPNLDYDALKLVKPLSDDEIQARFKSFEQAGYDTAGFDMPTEDEESESAVYSRPVYPDEVETRHVHDQTRTTVKLPDLAKWADYTAQLTEQKLAALGVSIGAEEPSAAPSPLESRQSSAQYPPLPFSPPIPSSSATSLGRPGMVRGHSHTMSVAAPISPLNGPFGHMHRHSTFTGSVNFPQLQTQQLTQQPIANRIQSFSPQLQQSATQPSFALTSQSPLNQFVLPGAYSAGSPGPLGGLRNELAAIRTGSPLSQLAYPRGAQDVNRGLAEDQLDSQNAYPFPVQQNTSTYANNPPTQATPILPQLPEEDEEPEEVNASKPESEVEEQAGPGAYSPQKRAQLNANIAVPMPRGHQHNISADLERDVLESEKRRQDELQNYIVVEEESSGQTSQSESSSAPAKAKIALEKDPLSQDFIVQETVHSHKKSASRFNVAAPPFKFNPGASFQPATTAFTFGAPGTKLPGGASKGHSRQQSSGTFNVAAPEFKPASVPSLPKSEFSFSARGPSFGSNALLPETVKTQVPSEPIESSTIFGKVEIPEFVKPVRRSKAIAIKKPDESSQDVSTSPSEVEDETGRIAQSSDRLKRQRKAGNSGDQIPQFAEPTPIPAPPEEFILKSQQAGSGDQDKERSIDETDAVASGNLGIPPKVSEESIDDAFDRDFDLAYGRREESDSKPANHTHKRSTSLSALAKPFQPKSSVTSHKAQTSASNVSGSQSELEEGEIREDDFSPLASPFESHDVPAVSHIKEPEQMPKILEDIQSRLQLVSPPGNDASNAEPSFAEIDAVMRQLNEVDGDQSAREGASTSPPPSPGSHPMPGVTYLPEWTRSDAPSPSPSRRPPPVNSQADSSFTIHERTDSPERTMSGRPQIHHLNRAVDIPTSDWSADFSVHDEEKLHQRGTFLDNQIDNMIGRVLDKRLQPLEESLRSIHNTVNKRPISRDLAQKRSSSTVESDADDEDETSEEQRHRPISRGRDKRIDQIKSVVVEALREQSPQRGMQTAFDLQELHSYLADMKASFARAASTSLELDDIRAVVEDAVTVQTEAMRANASVADEKEETHRRQKSELEARLNQTLAGMLEEANLRRAAEEREAESKRLLQQAEEELKALRNSSQEEDSRLATAEREKRDLSTRLEQAADSRRELEQQIKNLEDENEATYATLEEHRLSSHNWRQHIDQATREREDLDKELTDIKQQLEESQESNSKMRHDIDRATREREDFQKTISALELQLEESQDLGGSTKRRLEKLHADMAAAAGQLISEKSAWKSREEEHQAKNDSLEAQVASHRMARSEMEQELRDLRASAKEASEARSVLDQMRTSNSSLDDMVRNLQNSLAEQQNRAAGFERDFNDAKEAGRTEIQRVRASLEADVKMANHQVNAVRAELEGELSKLRIELENVNTEAESAKTRHERLLADERADGKEALRKLNDALNATLHETKQKHELSLHELQAAHKRAIDHALEDKQRAEYFSNQRLALSDAKLEHFQDKVLHLEERLEVAKSAAQAAAMSAQSRAVPAAPIAVSSVPEKVSPQALRESILVLQEQLQDRESVIEKLRSETENDAPAKIKSQEDEIAWLRELLTVRNEELTNLVNTLAQPTFDRQAVRDAAIRIRANLQMEQQEKERSGQEQSISEQAIAGLSNFATPKAVQLTSAFNKWRSNMESSALKNAPRGNVRPRSNTPVKASHSIARAPPGYMSGLMTPPASNLRSTPSPEATASLPALRLHSRPGSKSNGVSITGSARDKGRQPSTSSELPATPLFRSQSYDQDAEDSQIHMQAFEENTEDENLDEVPDNQPPAFRSLESELEDAGVDEAVVA